MFTLDGIVLKVDTVSQRRSARMSQLLFLIFLCVVRSATPDFTFKNVMVTCEDASDEEVPFGTVVTANKLKPHLPSSSCEKISIQHASIPVLNPGSLADITNISLLLLENDNIQTVAPGAFENVAVDEALSLKSNKLREIRRGVFNHVRTRNLVLSYNEISRVDSAAFDNMTLLETLFVDNNRLKSIDSEWFKDTPKLKKLHLQHNQILEIPPDAFKNLANNGALQINLNHNFISIVSPDAFRTARKIQFLGLAYNQLSFLPRDWLRRVKMNLLNLSNNRFACLNGGLAGRHSTNWVDGNPWNCKCLEDLKKMEHGTFGSIQADEALRRCSQVASNLLK